MYQTGIKMSLPMGNKRNEQMETELWWARKGSCIQSEQGVNEQQHLVQE